MAVPMMCVAALLDERRQATRYLSQRLRFEELLSHVSAGFVSLPSDAMAATFARELKETGRFMSADFVGLVRAGQDETAPWVVDTWNRPGHCSPSIDPSSVRLPWAFNRLATGLPICCASVDGLPPEAQSERRLASDLGVASLLVLPLTAAGRLRGAFCLAATAPRDWTTVDVAQMQLVAEVFSNALARKESEDQLRSHEATKSAILASLSSQIAVFDRAGRIIAMNDAWRAATSTELPDAAKTTARLSQKSDGHDHEGAEPWVHGLDEVLEGRATSFAMEYASGHESARAGGQPQSCR